MILGIAWFVNYAIVEGWIVPIGRIMLGLVVGASILLLGRYRLQTFLSQRSILMFIGALAIILTLWAGRELYDFFTPASVLVMIFITSALLGVTSVFIRYKPLAYANVFLGAIASLLTASPTPSLVGLYTYLMVLSQRGMGGVNNVVARNDFLLTCNSVSLRASFH